MFSYPSKLLYVPRKFGGFGLPCFSILASTRKFHKLFGCLRSKQTQGLAAKGVLSRLARKHGYVTSANQGIIIHARAVEKHDRKIYMDGPFELLQQHNLTICRAGYLDKSDMLTCLLPTVIPAADTELREYCYHYNLLNIADLTSEINGTRVWQLDGPLDRLKASLPTTIPTTPIPLL